MQYSIEWISYDEWDNFDIVSMWVSKKMITYHSPCVTCALRSVVCRALARPYMIK